MYTPFEIFSQSLAKADKPKNGDYCDYVVLNEPSTIVALALADGVGSKPCDYLASATAVNVFLQNISQPSSENLLERIQNACAQADEQVISAPSNCAGMMTTFVAIVWDTAKNLLYYTSVGDSRIYLQRAGSLMQLTQDDSIDKTKKIGGQTQLRSYITRALGTGEVQFDIQSQSFFQGEACWLVSDGFYNALHQIDFELSQLWKYQDFKTGSEKLFQQYQPHYQDDASVVALRLNNASADFESHFQAWKQQNFPESIPANLQQPALIRTIFDQLGQTIKHQQITETLQFCKLITDLEIYPTLKTVEELLQRCQEANFNNQEVYKALRKLLMRAVK